MTSHPFYTPRGGAAGAAPARQGPKPMRLALSSKMPYGKHKGSSIEHLCKLVPHYVHFLIDSKRLTATAAVCAAIQQGYNHEAIQRNAEAQSRAGKYTRFILTPFTPKQAPNPCLQS